LVRFNRILGALLTSVGPWVADYLWKYLLRDKIISKLIQIEEVQASQTADVTALQQLDQDISLVRQAESFVAAQNIPDPDMDTDVTVKVQTLYHYLASLFKNNPDVRCIVFVDRRTTAVGLSGLFNILEIPHMRVASITGRGRADSASYDRTASLREQMLAVYKFRRGVYNCLFATSVAEEGLDIPDCNVIVRFDLYSTMIQYVQSRGRARHIDSTVRAKYFCPVLLSVI
jgi:endoribonuclease Dicer